MAGDRHSEQEEGEKKRELLAGAQIEDAVAERREHREIGYADGAYGVAL
jgi:hypothetical protein